MAISLTTGGGINLNNKTNYWLVSLDIGSTNRDESWLQPAVLGAPPTLMGYWDRAGIMSVTLRVKAATVAALRTALENVRNEFVTSGVAPSKGADNYLTWNDGTTVRTFVTYASPIDPVPLEEGASGATMMMALGQFTIPEWSFDLTRSPYYDEEKATKRTPVI